MSGTQAYGVLPPPTLGAAQLALKYSSYVAIGTQTAIPDGLSTDTTSNTLNSRMGITALSLGNVTDITLSYPQFSTNVPEVDFGVQYVVTAAIEYPAGTFYPVYTSSGSRSLTVTPGRGFVSFQPCPIYIPAGTRFWVKSFASWTPGNFYLASHAASWVAGDGTARGTGLSDNTLVAGTPTTTSNYGFGPSVYGRISSPSAVVGLIGDSIMQTATESGDPVNNWTFIERAMRGVVPVLNIARNGDQMAIYLQRYDGRTAALRDSITHLFMGLGRNDLGSYSVAVMQANYAKIINPYLTRGIKVIGNTITPYATSTDNWITTANQTVVTSGNREVDRVVFNAWLRANWKNLGLSALCDWAHVVDPTDSGKWMFDPVGTGRSAEGYGTLTNGVVSSCIMGSYLLSGNSGGNGYAANATTPCSVISYPGSTGGGAVITGNANGSGLITSYNIISGGTGYNYAPMIAPMGSWTNDGIHPDARGYNAIIAGCQIGPEMLT